MANDYLLQMNKILADYNNSRLLLHSCCAPCSSFCLLNLRNCSEVSVYFYNPNISDPDEYYLRYEEQKRLIGIYNDDLSLELPKESVHVLQKNKLNNRIDLLDSCYEPDLFFEKTKGYEDCPERGKRCEICFDMRLRNTAITAKNEGYDLFATTLTLSPLKNAELINEIGFKIGKEIGIQYLPTDFKKKNGYKMSVELSKQYGLYRQNYCGCVYSKRPVDL